MTDTDTKVTMPLTAAQGVFIGNLLREREGYSDGFRARVVDGVNTQAMSKAKASEVISWLLKLPKRAKPVGGPPRHAVAPSSGVPGEDGTPPLATADAVAELKTDLAAETGVPAGHYAAAVPGSKETLSFFRVDRPTVGKWAGYTFVKHIVGGHPDYPVRGEAKAAALAAIKDAGVVASATRYAKEFRRCVHCNCQLTDETSRRLCVGPVCRGGKAKGGMTPLLELMAAAMVDA